MQEASPSAGVLTHRADGPIAGLEVEGPLGEDGVDRVGPGDGRPRLCAGSDVSPHRLRPFHFPDRRVLHTGQDPLGEALPPLPRALGIAEPGKAKQGDRGAWVAAVSPGGWPAPAPSPGWNTAPLHLPHQLAAPTEHMSPAAQVKDDCTSGGKQQERSLCAVSP